MTLARLVPYALFSLLAIASGSPIRGQVINSAQAITAGWPCAKDYLAERAHPPEPILLASAEILTLVVRSFPLDPPCCSSGINIKGEVEIDILIGRKGKLACSRAASGNPLAMASAIASLSKWRFRPYYRDGAPRVVVGRAVLRYDFTRQQ